MPNIYHYICLIREKLDCYAEILIIFGTVYTLYSVRGGRGAVRGSVVERVEVVGKGGGGIGV